MLRCLWDLGPSLQMIFIVSSSGQKSQLNVDLDLHPSARDVVAKYLPSPLQEMQADDNTSATTLEGTSLEGTILSGQACMGVSCKTSKACSNLC